MKTKKIKKEEKQQCNINDVSVAKRKLCPTCGSDSLITLSDITYCMNDCCDGVKGHTLSVVMTNKGSKPCCDDCVDKFQRALANVL